MFTIRSLLITATIIVISHTGHEQMRVVTILVISSQNLIDFSPGCHLIRLSMIINGTTFKPYYSHVRKYEENIIMVIKRACDSFLFIREFFNMCVTRV